ncbi:MAG: Mov34/MPN/PAD-1 family protein [Bacillota bacterium]
MIDSLVYKIVPYGRLKVAPQPLSKMLSYQQHQHDVTESGGLVAGRYLLDCDDIVIDVVTVPMKGDIQERYFFKKNAINHQRLLEMHWKQSKGTCNYIGDWHTHPEPIPHPSSHDCDQWLKVLKETKTDQVFIFFIVVGTQQVRIWQGFRKSGKIREIFLE